MYPTLTLNNNNQTTNNERDCAIINQPLIDGAGMDGFINIRAVACK